MYQIDKLRIIESDAVPKEGAKIEVLSTSIKITHTCGCVLVEHFAAGKPDMRREGNPKNMTDSLPSVSTSLNCVTNIKIVNKNG